MAIAVPLSSCERSTEQKPAASTTVTGARIAAPRSGPPGEWPMPGADYSNSRYSELTQITAANVSGLHAAGTFSTGVLR